MNEGESFGIAILVTLLLIPIIISLIVTNIFLRDANVVI